MQIRVTAHESGLAETARIRFRIGINHGSVLVDGDDLLGDVVNIAARLESLAPPGGICVSRAVHDLLRDLPPDEATPLGLQYVRNMPMPVEVWQIRTGVDQGAPNLTRAMQTVRRCWCCRSRHFLRRPRMGFWLMALPTT